MPVVGHLVGVIIQTNMEGNGNNNINILYVLIQTKKQLV